MALPQPQTNGRVLRGLRCDEVVMSCLAVIGCFSKDHFKLSIVLAMPTLTVSLG